MNKPFIIAVDFDGTIVEHEYPDIGNEVPGAISWLRRFADMGCRIILLTMRGTDGDSHGGSLGEAVRYLQRSGVFPWAVNQNPEQCSWTDSAKVYAHVYIDDAAAGCPLRQSLKAGGRPMVDWEMLGPVVMKRFMESRP